MSAIELNDSVGVRRIPVPSLAEPIRIELDNPDGPRIIVPPDVIVERRELPTDVNSAGGGPA